jgi:hypothetical protein
MFLKKVSQKYKILAEDKNPIERSLTLSLTLREAAITLGHTNRLISRGAGVNFHLS